MDALQILALISGILGIVGLTGGAVGYFAKGRGDSIIAYQTKENELLKADVARLEKSLAATTAERDSLLNTNETLKGLAQGTPQLTSLTNEIRGLVKYLKKIEKRGV